MWWWFYAVFIGTLKLTNSASLVLCKGSLDNNITAPLETAESLLQSPCYNSSLKSLFYTFGYMGECTGPATTTVVGTALKLNCWNVFLFNWQKEASSVDFLGTLGKEGSYFCALKNAIILGKALGRALCRMSEYGLDLKRIRLIAHSLGAHLFGYTGREVKCCEKSVARITGLDPAGPVFDQAHNIIVNRLGKGDADFVDCYHTDRKGYGENVSNASADFYFNDYNFGDAGDQVQPGCPVGKSEMFSDTAMCSHNRVWMYFAETWTNPGCMQACAANNYEDWAAGRLSSPEQCTVLGDDTDTSCTGKFYLNTNSEPPFGRGADGLHP